ncbi:MAG: hypothetical protein RIR26_398 [Pseudomonadota bacterium]|jgi:hypothetical protein
MREDDNSIAKDYAIFVEDETLPMTPIEATAAKDRIRKDLVRSPGQMALIYFGLSVVGYIASLAVCAQNAFGLSAIAHAVSYHIHQLPDPWCPILCGSVFTGIPFVLSLMFLNRFQHRYLIFRMWWFFASVPVFATGLMMILPSKFQHARMSGPMADAVARGDVMSNGAWMALWAASAILLPYILEGIVYLVVRPRRYIAARSNRID